VAAVRQSWQHLKWRTKQAILHPMDLNARYYPPNPLYPRPSGRAGAGGTEKQILQLVERWPNSMQREAIRLADPPPTAGPSAGREPKGMKTGFPSNRSRTRYPRRLSSVSPGCLIVSLRKFAARRGPNDL